MKFKTLFFFLTVSFIASAGGGKQLLHKENVIVDGQLDEWSNPLPNYDVKTGINYDVANDAQNLYLMLKIVDVNIQRQLLSNGFEVWINTEGKKKKNIGITYPLPMGNASMNGGPMTSAPNFNNKQMPQGGAMANAPSRAVGPNTNRSKGDRMESETPLFSKELILTGFNAQNGKKLLDDSPIRPVVTIDKSGSILYEIAIPLKSLYKEQPAIKKGTTFSIGFIVKKSTNSARSTSASQMPGGMSEGGSMGGGMGSRGGGGMGGGMGGSMGGSSGGMGGAPNADSQEMGESGDNPLPNTNTEKQYWFKVLLAE